MATKRRLNPGSTYKTIVDNGGRIPARWLRSQKKLGPVRARSNWCETMQDVIDALDGVPKVAALAQSRVNNVLMWQRDTGRFPAKTYTVLRRALVAKGYDAPPGLWGMLEP